MPADPDGPAGWDPDRYDDAHAFVYEYGEDLLSLLSPTPGDVVLDLGCGTGHLTAAIEDAGARAVGVDRSGSMVRRADDTYPDLDVAVADARALPFDGSFDAVLSNAVLHWIDEQDAAIASIHDALRPGGRLVCELGGRGNVATIVDALTTELRARGYAVSSPWYFPGVGAYATRLEAHGFEVRRARLFDRPTELAGGPSGLEHWLRQFGDPFFGPLTPAETDAVIEAVQDRLRPRLFTDGTWVADYRRLRILAVRPDRDDRGLLSGRNERPGDGGGL